MAAEASMSSLKLSGVKEYLNQYEWESCGADDEDWYIDVAYKELGAGVVVRGDEIGIDWRSDSDVPKLYADIISWLNKVMPTCVGIACSLEAFYLRRVEGGIGLRARSDMTWREAAEKYNYTGWSPEDPLELPHACVRLSNGTNESYSIGTGGIVRFRAWENCPRVVMMLLDMYFDKCDGARVVKKSGYPPEDEFVWIGDMSIWPNPRRRGPFGPIGLGTSDEDTQEDG
jgi:hypothetical protein